MNCEVLLKDLLVFSGYRIILVGQAYDVYDLDDKCIMKCVDLTDLLRFLLVNIASNLDTFWLK